MEIKINNKSLTVKDIDIQGIDISDYSRIDAGNIEGELLTISNFMGEIALIRADLTSSIEEEKERLKVLEANLELKYRKSLVTEEEDTKGVKKLKHPTETAVKSAIERDASHQKAVSSSLETKRAFNVIEAVYWTLRTKEGVLKTLKIKEINNGLDRLENPDKNFLN